MTLHILYLDKFTKPFYYYLTEVMHVENQQFLFVSEKKPDFKSKDNLFFIKSPIRKNIFHNLILFFTLVYKSERIVLHGNPLLYFFFIFPFFFKKISWVIYGYELYGIKKEKTFFSRMNRFVLSRISNHITHIKGDSDLANQLLHSKAKFVYSPMYLSNVTKTDCFHPQKISTKKHLKILVGNSSSPTNNHIDIFNKIIKYDEDIEFVYCPLSYGVFDDYKERVIQIGNEMFRSKFIPVLNFMTIEEYELLLTSIDIAIFNHTRQEAMGVTLLLLSLGKIVYLNSSTTSYEALINRGFQIFDNTLIDKYGLKEERDVNDNYLLLQKYYSEQVFRDSIITISKL